VRFPPITDLPQHVAQVRLFQEAWQDPSGPYRIQWLTPYSLQYLLLAGAWAIAGPAAAGRVGMLMVGLLWVTTFHLIAYVRRRPPAGAALASTLFFTKTTYWGFYGFAIGWPLFALWLLLTTGRRRDDARWFDALLALGIGVLLYVVHVLWLGAAVLWLAVSTVVLRVPIRATLMRALGLAPVLIVTAIWYPRLSAGGFTSPTVWIVTPTGRLSFNWLVNGLFGGLRGPIEFGIVAILALWALLACVQHRTSLRAVLDVGLLTAAAIFFAFALILPDKHSNTILFSLRWLPIAGALALLACPPVRARGIVTRLVPLCVLALLSFATISSWRQFESEEMSGLAESLATLPQQPRVIGLDFVKYSEFVMDRPFLQTFAYAQVLHGGRLNFSFADFVPSPVVFRDFGHRRWTLGLEWFPERVQASDLAFFDYALVNGNEAVHERFSRLFGVPGVTGQGRWRLYRLQPNPGAKP
jgi:prepilin-type processing-associated H-X9-DG protein